MASWDELKSRISRAGKASVVKTRTLAKIATVNGKISDTRKNINTGCRELGRILVDSAYADDSAEDIRNRIDKAEAAGEDRELLEAVLRVKEYEEELDELIYEKGQLQGITACRVCGAEVTADSDYCSKCGASVIPEDEPLYEEPAEGEDTEPAEGEGTEPAEGEDTEPAEGEDTEPADEQSGSGDEAEDTDEDGTILYQEENI